MKPSKKGSPRLTEEPPSQPSSGWPVAAICLALAAITFAVFGQTLTHEFINFDDNDYVYKNPVVAEGLTLKGVAWAFDGVHAANWHPLTWLSHMVDCQLYGLHPWGHHLTNVLLHTATVIALFLVLREMTGALWRSAFVAAVFAIHPLRAESVAWVAERKDVLSGLFFMLTMGAYVRYARRPFSFWRYGLVVLMFALGLMSKPMLVTLPVVLLLLDYWPLKRTESPKRLLLEKLPLLALSGVSGVATLVAQSGAIHSGGSFSLLRRLENGLTACMVYLGQMVWPSGLALHYPIPPQGAPVWEVSLAGVLLAGISAAAWRQRRRNPWLLVGWLWYLVMLLPVIGIVQVGIQAHADRYTYLPQIGIYIAMAWLVADWAMQRQTDRTVLASLMTGALALLMICAWNQTRYWKDSETVWEHTLACTTGTDVARYSFGNALLDAGKVDEAISQYKMALEINPICVEATINLGTALRQKGSLQQAIVLYERALLISPDNADAHAALGTALRQTGRLDEAIAHFQKALEMNPDDAKAHFDLGNVFLQMGRIDDAIPHYRTALEIDPGYEKANNNLGTALLRKGRREEAIAQFQQALRVKPNDPEVQNNLAWMLATDAEPSLRDGNKAVELASQANALTGGDNPLMLHTLAAALAETGRFSEAVETAQRALRLADVQSNIMLVRQLQIQLPLYQAGRPFHGVAQTR